MQWNKYNMLNIKIIGKERCCKRKFKKDAKRMQINERKAQKSAKEDLKTVLKECKGKWNIKWRKENKIEKKSLQKMRKFYKSFETIRLFF